MGGLEILLKVFMECNKYSDSALISGMMTLNRLMNHVRFRHRIAQDGILPGILSCFEKKNSRVN